MSPYTWRQSRNLPTRPHSFQRRRSGPFFGRPLKLAASTWHPEHDLAALERRIISPDGVRAGIVVPADPRLIRYLAQHVEEIHGLTPRAFEELIARLLHRSGYEVSLGPLGRDGGVDILAERRGEFGPELTLVQCKRYRDDHKVGEPVVKQFYAELFLRNATRGLVVTTSTFTSSALQFIESVRYRLVGQDIHYLKAWLEQLRGGFDQPANIAVQRSGARVARPSR